MAVTSKGKSLERSVLEGVRELNLQWLELLATPGIVDVELAGLLQRAGAAIRQRAACCPFPLLDFQFANGEYWRQWQTDRGLEAPTALPYFNSLTEGAIDVARSALILAWWSCRADGRTAEAILGIAPDVSALIRELTPAQIERIARCRYGQVRPRWVERRFLAELLAVAKRDRPRSWRAVHSRGLQLLTGECTRQRISKSRGLRSVPHRSSP